LLSLTNRSARSLQNSEVGTESAHPAELSSVSAQEVPIW
jgi:hypothetical protein